MRGCGLRAALQLPCAVVDVIEIVQPVQFGTASWSWVTSTFTVESPRAASGWQNCNSIEPCNRDRLPVIFRAAGAAAFLVLPRRTQWFFRLYGSRPSVLGAKDLFSRCWAWARWRTALIAKPSFPPA
jgi:hypothetical protein